jgi:hypothetical protein
MAQRASFGQADKRHWARRGASGTVATLDQPDKDLE